jgi:hypothetical protein
MLDLAAAEARPNSRISRPSAAIDGLALHPPATQG